MYCIQHCRPSDSTVSEDAGIEPRTVATSALAVRSSNHSARTLLLLGQISFTLGRSHPFSARPHPQYHTRLDLIHTRLDLTHSRLDLIHNTTLGQISFTLGQISSTLGQTSSTLGQISSTFGQISSNNTSNARYFVNIKEGIKKVFGLRVAGRI